VGIHPLRHCETYIVSPRQSHINISHHRKLITLIFFLSSVLFSLIFAFTFMLLFSPQLFPTSYLYRSLLYSYLISLS
jgi:uncharacterized membrane protein YagU involved in acid resistance